MNINLLAGEMDFVFFFYGASFLMLGAVCFALLHRFEDKRQDLPWQWMGLFGFIHGLNEWSDMLAVSLGDNSLFKVARFFVLVVSFLCLFEFGRRGVQVVFHRKIPGAIYGFFLILGSLGAWQGWALMNATARYFFGFPSALLAAAVLFYFCKTDKVLHTRVSRISLYLIAGSIFCYGLAAGLIVGPADFFPANVLNTDVFLRWMHLPIQFFRGVFVFLAVIGIIFFAAWENMFQFFRDDVLRQRRFLLSVFFIIIVFLGFFATARKVVNLQSRRVQREERETRQLKAKLFVQVVEMAADRQRGVEALSSNPQIVSALQKNPIPEDDVNQFNERIDRYQKALGSDVIYLMDMSGLTVASSNRNTSKSFVGKNYAFRPYFQKAIAGEPSIYMAKDVTTGERGLYAAYPVCGAQPCRPETVVGVIVAKGRMDQLKKYFISQPLVFLLSPEGIIFVSSKPDLVFRSIREFSDEEREFLRESQQFGQGPWDSVGFRKGDQGDDSLYYQGKSFAYAVQDVPSLPGWKIFLLEPKSQVAIVRLVLILIFAGFFLFGSIVMLFLFRISLDALRIASSGAIYEVLVEGMPDGVELYSEKGHCLAINKAGMEIMGWQKSDVLGRSFASLWPAECQETVAKALAVVRAGRPTQFEVKLTGVRGDSVFKKVHLLPILGAYKEMKFFIAHSRDMTQERQAHERLSQTSKMSTVGAMATGIAHEFNNVLEIILGHAELAHSLGDQDAMKRALRVIIDSTRRASWIVKTMLDFSGRSSQNREYVDIVELIKQCLFLLAKLIESSEVTVETHFEEVPRVFCNPGQMSQVLMNIIVNARDAMRGLPERKLTIDVKGDIAASVVRITFRDTGMGICKEVRDKIFGPFVTTKGIVGGGEDRQPGVGLGLFVAYGIVKQHGGDITFESEEGKGTTFCITLSIFPKEGAPASGA